MPMPVGAERQAPCGATRAGGSEGFHVETAGLRIAAIPMSINVRTPGANLLTVLLEPQRMLLDGDASVAVGSHVETSLSGITAKAMSINVWPPPGRNPPDHPARPRADAVRWRCRGRLRFPRGNRQAADRHQADVHQRWADVRSCAFNTTRPTSSPPNMSRSAFSEGAEPFGRTPPTGPLRQTQRLASYGPIWAQGSDGFHVETGVSCIAATPRHRCPSTSGRRARSRQRVHSSHQVATMPQSAFAEAAAFVGIPHPASQHQQAEQLGSCGATCALLEGQKVSTWRPASHESPPRSPSKSSRQARPARPSCSHSRECCSMAMPTSP